MCSSHIWKRVCADRWERAFHNNTDDRSGCRSAEIEEGTCTCALETAGRSQPQKPVCALNWDWSELAPSVLTGILNL